MVQAIYDFSPGKLPCEDIFSIDWVRFSFWIEIADLFHTIPEGPGELALTAGDVATMVEQVDSEWYRGTCKGATGFFPANFVQVLVRFCLEILMMMIQQSLKKTKNIV